MKIIMLGAPGAGKGTLSEMVYKKYMIPPISTGDLLREAVKNKTDLGLSAKQYMDRGELVPDDLVIRLLQERIAKADCNNGFILDGFPRTIAQAEAIEDLGISIDRVYNFVVSQEKILERLTGRRTCKSCGAIFHIKNRPPKTDGKCDKCDGELYQREDQKPEVIKQRLDVYEKQTAPLIGYYKEKNMLTDIDGESEADKVFGSLDVEIQKLE